MEWIDSRILRPSPKSSDVYQAIVIWLDKQGYIGESSMPPFLRVITVEYIPKDGYKDGYFRSGDKNIDDRVLYWKPLDKIPEWLNYDKICSNGGRTK
jgi:replication-associated recombination protein RarA